MPPQYIDHFAALVAGKQDISLNKVIQSWQKNENWAQFAFLW
jgi:hypothetical protein